jgi:hypothetical protein
MFILNHIKIIFFNIIYGKIKKIANIKKNKEIKIDINAVTKFETYKIYNIQNARLYTTSVHDTAIILNNELVPGASFQYRNNKKNQIINGNIFKNIVLKNGTPKFKKKFSCTIISLLTGGAGKTSYFHWMFDVLPRLKILKKIIKKQKNIYYLLPSLRYEFQKETIKKLKISLNKCLSSDEFKHISSDNLIVADHPYTFDNNPSKSILHIPSWIIKWLKQKLFFNKKVKNNYPKKIYIDRSDSNFSKIRYITNEDEVKNTLKLENFSFVSLSSISFEQQAQMFYNADIIVGLHGAGFTNIIFSKPGCKIIELQSKTAGDVIKNLAIKCKLNYKRLSPASTNKNLPYQSGSIHVNISKLKRLIL